MEPTGVKANLSVQDIGQALNVLVAGDTLHSLAFRAYGNAELWRKIAAANEIDDPMRLRPGTRVLVPFRMVIPTPFGTAMLEATTFNTQALPPRVAKTQ